MIAQALFLGLIFGIWRLVDGGFKRDAERVGSMTLKLIGWVAFGYVLLATVMVSTVQPLWYALMLGVPFGIMLNRGYEDWDDWQAMLERAAPIAIMPIMVAIADWVGHIDTMTNWHGVAFALVVVSNVSQPWLRRWADRLPGHGNWYVEFAEGAALGVAVSLTVV